MNKEKIKEMQLNATFEASDGSNDKSDLEFIDKEGNKAYVKSAEMHLNIDFSKGANDQTPEFQLIESYWDSQENINQAIDEAETEDIEE